MKKDERWLPRATVVALIALTGGVFGALPGYLAPQGYQAQAACTKVGRASIDPDGVPRCDCTTSEGSGNCTCVVACPPANGGGGFGLLD